MIETVSFGVIAACALASAILVVRTVNLVHAVLWLSVTLLSTAALYAMLGASFLAGVQALLYVGGVITLMIFGVMITRRHDGIVVRAESTSGGRAVLPPALLFGFLAMAVAHTDGLGREPVPMPTTADLGRALLGEHLLAFEALSLLLLAAIIGAVVIARRRDPGVRARGFGEPSARRAGEPGGAP